MGTFMKISLLILGILGFFLVIRFVWFTCKYIYWQIKNWNRSIYRITKNYSNLQPDNIEYFVETLWDKGCPDYADSWMIEKEFKKLEDAEKWLADQKKYYETIKEEKQIKEIVKTEVINY